MKQIKNKLVIFSVISLFMMFAVWFLIKESSKVGLLELPADLSAESKRTYILELLRSNNNCEFPCWWGITPEETNYDLAQDFLINLSSSYSKEELITKQILENYFFSLDENNSEKLIVNTYTRDKNIEYLSVKNINSTNNLFSLAKIINNYSEPSEIKYSIQQTFTDSFTVYLVLIYHDEGFLINYYSTPAQIDENHNLLTCLEQDSVLLFWNNNNPKPDDFMEDTTIGRQLLDFYETTNIDWKEFSKKENFLDEQFCIEIPVIEEK